MWERTSLSCFLLLLAAVCALPQSKRGGEVYPLSLPMPATGSKPPKYNDYRCRATRLPNFENYIVRYEPQADPEVVHHMLIYGCDKLRTGLGDGSTWNCKSSTVCGAFSHPKILYAWALNAPGFKLPPNVGQKVGPTSAINYIVVQIHYGPAVESGPSSSANPLALVLHMTTASQERVSGVYLIGSSTGIKAGKDEVIVDTACQFAGPKTIIPIAFRTHAHVHSRLIVGYVGDGEDKWTEIGFRSPQDPQAFYPVENSGISVEPGEWVASRCVYNTSGSMSAIRMGPDSEDEMCNFYIMYHTENDGRPLAKDDCWHPAPSHAHFPPLPVLPPSQGAHHHHSHMGGDDLADEEIEIIEDTTPKPITSPEKETTSPGSDTDKYDYVCPSPVPPGPVPSQCPEATPTNQPNKDKEETSEKLQIVLANDWPFNGVDAPHVEAETGRGGALGQVTSVAVAPDGSILVLHRGPRVWDTSTFTSSDIFVDAAKGPITTPTLLRFSSDGVLRGVWGGGVFYLPHSLTVDGRGGLWVTDVALHQVLQFSGLGDHGPSLILGHKLTPGSKPGYFCKPTDIAVSSSGRFYVADGYCNHRVLAYSPDGVIKAVLGDFPIEGKTLHVPHSLALGPSEDQLFVADRENKRIIVMDVQGGGNIRSLPVVGMDRVFAVEFSGLGVKGWPLLSVVQDDAGERGYGVVVSKESAVEMIWGAEQGLGKIHDLAVDHVNKAVYAIELTPARIWKYNIITPGTTQEPTETTRPSGTTQRTTETTQPSGTTQEPTETTQPSDTTQEPTETPPSGTTQEPTETTQPSGTTQEPIETTRPPGATQEPTETTRPSGTTQEPTETTRPSGTTQEPTETKTSLTTTDTTETTPTTAPPTTPTEVSQSPTGDVDNSSTSHSGLNNTSSEFESGSTPFPVGSASSGDADGNRAELTMSDTSADSAHNHSPLSATEKKMKTPAFHYGLFAAIFAIVGLILVVVVGILKEHRFFRFLRTRRGSRVVATENKSPRETLHSLLGPSKLGFSRLRTYDSDSEVEEFPIFSRQL